MNKWDKCYIDIAQRLAKESNDSKLKVGCVLVSKDKKQIYSCGVNGSFIGGPNKRESFKKGKSGFLCAEVNCLIKSTIPTWVEKILYCNVKPCSQCAKILVNAGVKEVYYKKEYKSNASQIFKQIGIKLIKIK